MSAETWIREFYPVGAKKVHEHKAIKHSLVKWYGLRKDNLRKHNLEEPPISLNEQTCALCAHHLNSTEWIVRCKSCPLAQFLGRSCDSGFGAPYWEYYAKRDPEPMIAALEAIDFVERTCK